MSFLGLDVPEMPLPESAADQENRVVNPGQPLGPAASESNEPFFSTSLLFGHVAYFTFRHPPATPNDFELYKRAFATYYDTHEKFLFFFDVRDLEGMNESFIQLKIDLLSAFKQRSTKQVKGTAIVLQSDGVRNLLNILFKVYRLTTPHALFTEEGSASTWIMGQLADTFGEEEMMRQLA
jgi:hypothetical protein